MSKHARSARACRSTAWSWRPPRAGPSRRAARRPASALWEVPDAGRRRRPGRRAARPGGPSTRPSGAPTRSCAPSAIRRLQDALRRPRPTTWPSSSRRDRGPGRAARGPPRRPDRRHARATGRDEPAGVTAVITPATSPLAVAIEEVGRVLAAGGTVVLKPAPEAASAALELGRIALDILPRGVLNVVSTRDVDVAIALTLDHRVDEVSFTGSAVAGRAGAGRRRACRQARPPRRRRAADRPRGRRRRPRRRRRGRRRHGRGQRRPGRADCPPAWSCPRTATTRRCRAAVEAMDQVVVGEPDRRPPPCAVRCARAVARDRVLRYLDLARAEGGDDRARRTTRSTAPAGGSRPPSSAGCRVSPGWCARRCSGRCSSWSTEPIGE